MAAPGVLDPTARTAQDTFQIQRAEPFPLITITNRRKIEGLQPLAAQLRINALIGVDGVRRVRLTK